MTDNELFHWLEQQNLTRDNIGEMLGYSKRTVDNWYSDQKIPDPARQHLRRIITESQQPGSLRFTLSQWDSIEAARIAAGYTDRTEFFTAALTDYARRHAPSADKITQLPDPLTRVADDEPPYTHTGKGAKAKGSQSKLA